MSHDTITTENQTTRRELLFRVAAGLPLSSFLVQQAGYAQTANEVTTPTGLIVRGRQPDNLESPFAELTEFYTPNERFYVRSHFAVPTLDVQNWRLRVEGAVDRPLELSYADLLALTSRTVDPTL
jgi:DMSO/TMAO reductase YedYZ molybdopterin-dependent catalytic subunit